jgi:hypothetical protein
MTLVGRILTPKRLLTSSIIFLVVLVVVARVRPIFGLELDELQHYRVLAGGAGDLSSDGQVGCIGEDSGGIGVGEAFGSVREVGIGLE